MARKEPPPSRGANEDEALNLNALVALYQAERAEAPGLLNANLTLIGVELAYLAASLAFLDKLNTVPVAAVALVPVPLWLGLMYNIVLIALSGARGASVLRIEDRLYQRAGLPREIRDDIGSRAGENIVNPDEAPLPYKLLLYMVYFLPFPLVMAYTIYLIVSRVAPAVPVVWLCVTAALYVLALAIMISAALLARANAPKLARTSGVG